MKNIGTKNLETKRLVLRKFLPSDYQKAYENYCTDERVTKYMTWNPHKDINETKTLVEGWASRYNDNKFYHWLITLKGVDEAIGSISVVEINEEQEEVEIGYCVGYDFWNKGIVTEATKEVIKYLFERVEVKSIVAKHDVRNIGSGKVMQKCDMMYYGQESGTNKGEDISLSVYKINKEDFK